MNVAEFRLQTGLPTPAFTGVVGIYANPQGVLIVQNVSGARVAVGANLTGTAPLSQAIFPGTTGIASFHPTGFALFYGPTGQKYGVPLFLLS